MTQRVDDVLLLVREIGRICDGERLGDIIKWEIR